LLSLRGGAVPVTFEHLREGDACTQRRGNLRRESRERPADVLQEKSTARRRTAGHPDATLPGRQ